MARQRNISAKEENEMTLEAMQQASKAKMKALRFFAEDKLEAYEESDILENDVRIYKSINTEGDSPKSGQTLTVKYQGYLPNGRKFDSGVAEFILGKGIVIQGWEIALKDMRIGEEATIFIPSALAYGKFGSGKDIKPYTTLIFDVSLTKVK